MPKIQEVTMMNYKLTAKMTCLSLALMLGPLSMASMAAQQRSDPVQASQSDLDAILKVSALLDTDVLNKANETIAGMKDLVLTPEGKVLYAVLSHGGVAGVGAKYFAVPWDVLDVRHVNGKWAVTLNMAKEALENAPTFQADDYKDLTNAEWVSRVHNFFNTRANREPEARVPQALQTVIRATKINDARLKNERNEDLGEVADLLLDRNYRVAYAIIGRGGVLGIGESYLAVPWSKLRLTYNRENTAVTAVIDATKQKLEQAPLVKGDDYATLLAPGFAGQVDRYFGVTRSASGTSRDNDNRLGNDRR